MNIDIQFIVSSNPYKQAVNNIFKGYNIPWYNIGIRRRIKKNILSWEKHIKNNQYVLGSCHYAQDNPTLLIFIYGIPLFWEENDDDTIKRISDVIMHECCHAAIAECFVDTYGDKPSFKGEEHIVGLLSNPSIDKNGIPI